MQRTFFRSGLLLLFMLLAFGGHAQQFQNPVSWDFSVKKNDKGQYDFVAQARIAEKWHIYAMQPGGDGSLIGTTLQFDKSVKLLSQPKELTPAREETLLDDRVRLHSGKARIGATLNGKPGDKVSGTVEYQACNDMMCLPPKTQTFTLTLP